MAALALACANSAHEYRDPDPASGPTAQVAFANPFYQAPFDTAHAMLHIYERGADCAKTYLGSVDLRALEQRVRIAAERDTLFELSIARADAYTCNVALGFTPRADARYRLLLRDSFGYQCLIEVKDESGEPVMAIDLETCEPRSIPLSDRSGSPARSSLSTPRPSIRR